MKHTPEDLDQLLDRAIEQIRDSAPDPRQEQAAADRVWQAVSQQVAREPVAAQPQTIRDCSDFQALIPAFLRGGLNDAKTLLLEDHVSECLPCRKALKQARTAQRRPVAGTTASSGGDFLTTWGWRIAAAAVIFIAVIGLNFKSDLLSIETGGVIRIQSLEGEVFQVTDEGNVPVRAGDSIDFTDINGLRTAKDSNAVLMLADNSLIEMNERAQLAVQNRRPFWRSGQGDAVVDLTRGSIIVEASDQGSGHLYVDTDDTEVAVTGTIFAVNHGIKGSRVSVIEGQVEVAHSGRTEILRPGQQSTSRPGLRGVAVEDEIAWSHKVEQHLSMMRELTRVTQEIEDSLGSPGLRYNTDLLDRLPRETVVFIGIPNLSSTLNEAYDMLQEKIAGNDVLRNFWQENVSGTEAEEHIEYAMRLIRDAGAQVGDEIAVTLQRRPGSYEAQEPLILMQLTRPDEFPDFVAAELDRAEDFSGQRPGVRVLQGELPAQVDAGADLLMWIHDGLLIVSPELNRLRDFDVVARSGQGSFVGTDFHARLSQLYKDGTEWVLGVDLAPLTASAPADEDQARQMEFLDGLGLNDLKHLIVERTSGDEVNENRFELSFNHPRRGLASWLAAPAPMGSLEFISPDTKLAAGFVMKEPTALVEDLFSMIGGADEGFDEALATFEAEHGIDVRQDIVAALGGEFAIALDGPVLPNPSWKLIVEVYDAKKLQSTIEWAVNQLNTVVADTGFQGLRIAQFDGGGRVYYEIESVDTGISVHYMFVDGYMVAGPSRTLLDEALRFRASGITITKSPKFLALLPKDSEVNFSAVVYQHLGSVLGPFAESLQTMASGLSEEHQEMLNELGEVSRPTLTLAYGGENRITVVHNDRGGLLGSGLGMLLRLDTLLSVQELLREAGAEETGHYEGPRKPAALEEDHPVTEPALISG